MPTPDDARSTDGTERTSASERTATILATSYEQKAHGRTPEEIQHQRSQRANVIEIGRPRSPHPKNDRQAIAIRRTGEYVTGERPEVTPEDAMIAVRYGLFATPDDRENAEPISLLALRFPSPEKIIVVRAGMMKYQSRWLALQSECDGNERPSGPVVVPEETVARYFYEIGMPDILPLGETNVSYEEFRDEERNEGLNPFEVGFDAE